jgi:hypothetical protein
MPVRFRRTRPGGRGKYRKLLVPIGETIAALPACSNANCVHGFITLRDYRSMLHERWDQSFTNQLAIAARRLHRTKYNAPPPLANNASRSCYPCGIIEKAYIDLRAQGIPLSRPLGPIGRARQERQVNRE